MSNLTIFIFGFIIFTSYMFFLLRMIWRQHSIQKRTNNGSNYLKLEMNDDEEEKLAS